MSKNKFAVKKVQATVEDGTTYFAESIEDLKYKIQKAEDEEASRLDNERCQIATLNCYENAFNIVQRFLPKGPKIPRGWSLDKTNLSNRITGDGLNVGRHLILNTKGKDEYEDGTKCESPRYRLSSADSLKWVLLNNAGWDIAFCISRDGYETYYACESHEGVLGTVVIPYFDETKFN